MNSYLSCLSRFVLAQHVQKDETSKWTSDVFASPHPSDRQEKREVTHHPQHKKQGFLLPMTHNNNNNNYNNDDESWQHADWEKPTDL